MVHSPPSRMCLQPHRSPRSRLTSRRNRDSPSRSSARNVRRVACVQRRVPSVDPGSHCVLGSEAPAWPSPSATDSRSPTSSRREGVGSAMSGSGSSSEHAPSRHVASRVASAQRVRIMRVHPREKRTLTRTYRRTPTAATHGRGPVDDPIPRTSREGDPDTSAHGADGDAAGWAASATGAAPGDRAVEVAARHRRRHRRSAHPGEAGRGRAGLADRRQLRVPADAGRRPGDVEPLPGDPLPGQPEGRPGELGGDRPRAPSTRSRRPAASSSPTAARRSRRG